MSPATADADALEAIRGWLGARCAMHYGEQKLELLRQRLGRVQRAFGLATLEELRQRVCAADGHDVQLAVMSAASTNHTYFFREIEVLERFRRNVLPELAAREEIRLWSAACSTGDEAYTLAILIAEELGLGALKRTQILGTDISQPMVERAEVGVYAARHLEHVPSDIRTRYFAPAGIGQFQVRAELRACCTFRRMNLKTTPYPFRKPFQAVFCRNLLYYFGREDQVATLEALRQTTEPGGWLVTSVTENVRELPSRWTAVDGCLSRNLGAAS